jgi:hypothetical protein
MAGLILALKSCSVAEPHIRITRDAAGSARAMTAIYGHAGQALGQAQ